MLLFHYACSPPNASQSTSRFSPLPAGRHPGCPPRYRRIQGINRCAAFSCDNAAALSGYWGSTNTAVTPVPRISRWSQPIPCAGLAVRFPVDHPDNIQIKLLGKIWERLVEGNDIS